MAVEGDRKRIEAEYTDRNYRHACKATNPQMF
jgi:hypothetical protein